VSECEDWCFGTLLHREYQAGHVRQCKQGDVIFAILTTCVTKRSGGERKGVAGKQAGNREAHTGNTADTPTQVDTEHSRGRNRLARTHNIRSKESNNHTRQNPEQARPPKAACTYTKWASVQAAQECESSGTKARAPRPGLPRRRWNPPSPGSKGAHGPPVHREEMQEATAMREAGPCAAERYQPGVAAGWE
jgi:hypothetical protein